MSAPSANDTCKVWIVVQTVATPGRRSDLEHTLMVLKDEKRVDALKEERESSEEFMSVDSREFTIKKHQSTVHVVFHYHDNYSDAIRIFETEKEARDYYISEIVQMDKEYLDDADDYSIKMQKFPGGGYMTTLYDENDDYPDKGSRWVMTTVNFASCATMSGGARKVRAAAKTRKGRKAARKMRR